MIATPICASAPVNVATRSLYQLQGAGIGNDWDNRSTLRARARLAPTSYWPYHFTMTTQSESTERVEYGIAPDLRRSCYYVIFGMAILACLAGFISMRIKQDPFHVTLAVAIGHAVVGAIAILPLLWRLQIDRRGISRWLFWTWSHWSWEDFASGKIHKRGFYEFRDERRHWRSLSLGHLEESERNGVICLINSCYQLPPPPPVPPELSLQVGFQRLQFSPRGITFLSRPGKPTYRWNRIEQLLIVRLDPLRRDFQTLSIVVAGESLVFRQRGNEARFRGASAEQLNEYLLQHVDADRILVTDRTAETVPQAHRCLMRDELRTQLKSLRILAGLMLPVMVIGPLLAGNQWLQRILLMGIAGVLPTSLLTFLYWDDRRRLKSLEQPTTL